MPVYGQRVQHVLAVSMVGGLGRDRALAVTLAAVLATVIVALGHRMELAVAVGALPGCAISRELGLATYS